MDISKGMAKAGEMGVKVRYLGIFLVVLGGLSIWAPQVTGKTLAVVIGILLILGGIGRTIFSWIAPSWGSAILRAAVGVLTVVAGIYILMQPSVGSKALAIVLMIYLFADGITSLLVALRFPPAVGGGWMLLGAIASIAVGVLMWMQWPASGELAVGVLIGIKLVLDGLSLMGLEWVARTAVN
jgi:uncharacterized membrane protein HdeD (DUF308 family)